MIATDDGPAVSIVSLISLAAASNAADHVVGTSVSPSRTSGSVTRSGLFSASNPNRPRSHSQPQFTASLSTPR